MQDYTKLIPEMTEWNHGDGIDIDGWIAGSGNFQLAIGYSVVFWPEFIEIEGYIVNKDVTKDNLQEWINTLGSDRKSIEATVNHLHILDIHHGCIYATAERLSYVGSVLKEIYECKLRRDFPGKKFKVEFTEGDADNLEGYELTFFQE
jgi:hypothetical protein